MRVGRVTVEILAPVPIEPLTVSARVVAARAAASRCSRRRWPGPDGEVMRARALAPRHRRHHGRLGAGASRRPGRRAPTALEFFPTGESVGWHTAMEIVFARGTFLEPGPATVWMRPRVALVEGEDSRRSSA